MSPAFSVVEGKTPEGNSYKAYGKKEHRLGSGSSAYSQSTGFPTLGAHAGAQAAASIATAMDGGHESTGRISPVLRRASLNLGRRNTSGAYELRQAEAPPNEEAQRYAEVLKQRKMDRRAQDASEDDNLMIGTKVDKNHANWVTAYNMLTGIRLTAGRWEAKVDRDLDDADFLTKNRYTFDVGGNELIPADQYDFKFKDYAPWVFRHLRQIFKQHPADYMMSLCDKYVLTEQGSQGKSGSFFYFSQDYKYIIKTIKKSEAKFLVKILPEYYKHVKENPNTLISQYYGLHRVKLSSYGRNIYFVIMNNLCPPHKDIHSTFDLKGSTVGRETDPAKLAMIPTATQKDLDFLRQHKLIQLGPRKEKLFQDQIERDVAFLKKINVMDYSLLVGIHEIERGNKENIRDSTLRVYQPGSKASTSMLDQVEARSPGVDGAGGSMPGARNSIAMSSPGGMTPALISRSTSVVDGKRKVSQLRQFMSQEKPLPMRESSIGMSDFMAEGPVNRDSVFYADEGGLRSTHEDGRPGKQIYYLGIIDCLTEYNIVKKSEHRWKALKHDAAGLSPIPAGPYGDRFISFIKSITKSPEQADRDMMDEVDGSASANGDQNPSATSHPVYETGNDGSSYIHPVTIIEDQSSPTVDTHAVSHGNVLDQTLSESPVGVSDQHFSSGGNLDKMPSAARLRISEENRPSTKATTSSRASTIKERFKNFFKTITRSHKSLREAYNAGDDSVAAANASSASAQNHLAYMVPASQIEDQSVPPIPTTVGGHFADSSSVYSQPQDSSQLMSGTQLPNIEEQAAQQPQPSGSTHNTQGDASSKDSGLDMEYSPAKAAVKPVRHLTHAELHRFDFSTDSTYSSSAENTLRVKKDVLPPPQKRFTFENGEPVLVDIPVAPSASPPKKYSFDHNPFLRPGAAVERRAVQA